MAYHPHERAALADALQASGPGAPTLCEGWRSEHLAAHVVLRETAPLVAAGLVLRPLAERTERKVQALGDSSATPPSYDRLVQRVRRGPGRLNPMGWAGDAAQLVELYVHTEDVRRAGGLGADVRPRERAADHEDALWTGLERMAGGLYRDTGVGVVLLDPTGREHRPRARGLVQEQTVVVRGPVGELLLHAFGRSTVAQVELDGPPAAQDAMRAARPMR